MKQKKKWYDYLWVLSLTYLILGFFNILFAWLGLLCFFIPLIISLVKGNKAYCNKYRKARKIAVFRAFPHREYLVQDSCPDVL